MTSALKFKIVRRRRRRRPDHRRQRVSPTPTVAGTIAFTREGEDEFGLADYDI